MEENINTTNFFSNSSRSAGSYLVMSTKSFEFPSNTYEMSGLSTSTSSTWQSNASIPGPNDALTCFVWREPARIILQVISLATFLFNILASVVVFNVDTNVRGRHVSFLFGCVRILNILDILQCFILIFGPILIPVTCDPNAVVCDILGFLFTCTALFSPLVVIVMAIDRCMAVYFHVLYKANPFVKVKYSCLLVLILINGVYLFLPCVTDFSAYVVVPWLSLCFIEWGLQYRLYDLILAFYTSILILILIVANVAILVKIRLRKRQIQKMNRSSSASSMKEVKKKRPSDLQKSYSKSYEKQKHHRSAEDVIDLSCAAQQSTLINTSSPVNQSPVLKRRNRKCPPPPIDLRPQSHHENYGVINREQPTLSPLLRNSNFFGTSSPVLRRANNTNPPKKRPVSLFSPLIQDRLSPNPISSASPCGPCISPLVKSELYQRNSGDFKSLRRFRRVPSADDLISSTTRSITPNRFSFSRPLLRQVLDYPGNKQSDTGNVTDSARSSEEIETLPRNQSSASSFFSLAFSTTRNASVRLRKLGKTRKIRKNVSRITKMTITICLVFIILYVPFLVRKLVQLVPNQYTSVSPLVEMGTLFGPFLSPLFNPIIYVFFNPHYKKSYKNLFKKMKTKLSLCFSSKKGNPGSKNRKSTKSSTNKASSLPTPNETDLPEDVFLPDNSLCGQVFTDTMRRRDLWRSFKEKNKTTKSGRAVSAL